MKPFVINKHGRLVFPATVLGELDFSVLHTLDQFTAVIGRDFNVLLGVLLMSSLLVIVANACVDLLQAWLDPRIQEA